MTTLAYRYLREAREELRAAARRYELERPGLGLGFEKRVQEAVARIRRVPMASPVWPGLQTEPAVRRALVHRFPFAIGYVVHEHSVVIVAVAHTRRKPGYWVTRLKAI